MTIVLLHGLMHFGVLEAVQALVINAWLPLLPCVFNSFICGQLLTVHHYIFLTCLSPCLF